jgi:hypothetical protein
MRGVYKYTVILVFSSCDVGNEKQSWGKEVCSEVDNREIHHQGYHFCNFHDRYSI